MAIRWNWFGNTDEGEVPDDPEELLRRAQEEMRDLHARNRERAVQAITQKNNLEWMVERTRQTVENLRQQAQQAEQAGNYEEAARCRHEVTTWECELVQLRAQFEEAQVAVEQIKKVVREEESRLRYKVAEALALQAQWRTLSIERSLAILQQEAQSGGTALSSEERLARHQRNRNTAVEAVTARNYLRETIRDTEREIEALRQKASLARTNSDDASERQFLREIELLEANLETCRRALGRANTVAEEIIQLVRTEEALLREARIPLPPEQVPPEEMTPTPIVLQQTKFLPFRISDETKRLLIASALILALIVLGFLMNIPT